MSKSSANGVPAIDVLTQYGADVTRLHVHFLGGYEDNTPWTFDGINGIMNFINRVWSLGDIVKGDEVSKEHIYDLNRAIKKVGEDLEDLKLNTAISTLMSFLKRVKEDGFITKEELRQFLILLNPIAPHITSEMYEMMFDGDILNDTWPKYDEKYLVEDEIEVPIQVNGKLRGVVKSGKEATKEEIFELAKGSPEIAKYLTTEPKKIIYVAGKIFNIVV